MPNIELRRNVWYATLHVPADARLAIGKSKFFESLKTTDKRTAELRAAPLVAKWKSRIAEVRGSSDPFIEHALMWKREYETNEAPDVVRDFIEEESKKLAKVQGNDKAFYAIATGQQHPLRPHYRDWLAQLTLVPKSVGQMERDVGELVGHFGTIEAITSASVRDWVRELTKDRPASQGVAAKKASSHATIKRIMWAGGNFWRYLQDMELASIDLHPFKVPAFAKPATKKGISRLVRAQDEPANVTGGLSNLMGKGGWIPFQPGEVVTIRNEAISKGDKELADLIHIAMYTGARIEELCSLKLTECSEESISIADSKTVAGVRTIPVHSMLRPTVKRLIEQSKDGYLLSGLTFNKYGDRSNAIGKRFGRLKNALDFPDKKVFHSIRKTVITMLENAGISENLAADIVGHEKPRITYGLYSEGHTLAAMREALERVTYP